MADPLQPAGDSRPLIWTFVIRGGQACELTLPRNPTLRHPGGSGSLTVWKLLGTPATAQAATALLLSVDALVEHYGECQTEEQQVERLALLKGPGGT